MMRQEPDIAPSVPQSLTVFPAEGFVVTSGVNFGDGLSFADELSLDDIYMLDRDVVRRQLSIQAIPDSEAFEVSAESSIGSPGNQIFLDCAVTFMSPDSAIVDGLVLVEVEGETAVAVYLLPLAHIAEKTEYTLVGIDTKKARRKFAEAACVSFSRGTHITLASGTQCKIEDLRVGDQVLTRDDGAQSIRWIGHVTTRAIGDFAPIVIRRGALNNENDLVVSPDHRLFIYQRNDELGAGRSEVLVKARHLVNGTTVLRTEGGFVDYFQLLFDSHQIIYAEGIAAESLLIDRRTRPALPDDVDAALAKALPGHENRSHLDFEVKETLLHGDDTAERLRRASTR